jgi:hypothetical protein
MDEPLMRRPMWRDALVWSWLLSLPLAYAGIFTFAERTQAVPADGADEWARTVAVWLGLWSVAVLGGGLLLRNSWRRTEARLLRLLMGLDDVPAAVFSRGKEQREEQ